MADLVADLLAGLSRLVRGEIALARAEAARRLRDAAGALVGIVVAAILGLTALNVLAGAAVAGLVAAGFATVWAGVLVGLALLVVAMVLLAQARARLRPANLALPRSATNLRRDGETLKSMVAQGAAANPHP
ncbi:MAG: phage holin family protein [Pseudomonadota bacterium]